MVEPIRKSINGEVMKGWEFPKEKIESIIPFNNWERREVNPLILQQLECRKVPKEVLIAFASGSDIPSSTGTVFGICEVRIDGEKIDRDHYIGYLTPEGTIFITHDRDKSKEHNYSNLEQLENDINKNPPHERDK